MSDAIIIAAGDRLQEDIPDRIRTLEISLDKEL